MRFGWVLVALCAYGQVGGQRLQPGHAVERKLSPKQTDEYSIEVPAGQFVHLVAMQKGVDVAVKILDPQGKTVVEADRPNGEFGPEAVSFLSEAAGEYRIHVVSGSDARGAYSIELMETRPPTDADRGRTEAERAEFEGSRALQSGDRQAAPHAMELLERAGAMWHTLQDSYEEGLCWGLIGGAYRALKQPQKALEYFNRAETLLHGTGDRESEADCLSSRGDAYVELGEKQKSVDDFTHAAALYQAAGDRSGELHSLVKSARAYQDLFDKDKALELYSQSLDLSRAIGNSIIEALVLNNLGTLYSEKGDQRKALGYFNEALPILRATGSKALEGYALNNLAMIHDALGERQKALEFYGQALPLLRAAGNKSGEATALNNMAIVYSNLGDKQKALEFFNQSLPIMRAEGDKVHEATVLSGIGLVYSDLGEKQKALDYFGPAADILHNAGDKSGEAKVLNNMGVAYLSLGDRQKAAEYFLRVLALVGATHDRQGAATVLLNVASIYGDSSHKDKAIEYYNKALTEFRAMGNSDGEVTALLNIGYTYERLGDRTKALEYLDQALPLSRATGNRAAEADILNNMGGTWFDLGDYDKARDFFCQALPIRRAIGDRVREAYELNGIARTFAKSRPELAILLGKQAVNLLQGVRRDNRGLEDSSRKSFEQSVEYAYRFLAGVLVDRHRFGEAEEVLNLLKDKEAADFIRRDAVTDQLKAATLLEPERKALLRYEQIVAEIVAEGQAKSVLVAKAAKEALNDAESQRAEQLDRDLAAANTVLSRYFDEQEKALAANSGAAKRIGELKESEGLQDTLQALGPDVVAIYTLVLSDRYTAMLITSSARKAYSTAIKETDLNRKIFKFRQQLQSPNSNPLPLAQELYKIVFPEGLRQDLDAMHAKTLMWSIDSTLRYVPIAALHDGQNYLVERFRNSLITPASLTRLSESSQAQWRGVGFGVSQAKGDFSALPSVPEELERIFRQGDNASAPVPGPVRLNGDFTRASFEAAMRQPQKAVVHIATHFDSRPGVAAKSHLLLGDGTELSLADIEATPRLFSGVDLLTLSACSTAFTNGTEDGREVDSFGTIAQRLGARGVIASLWSVNDEATARLMETMYRIRQGNPELGKSEALRQAQEQMANGVLKPDGGGAEGRGIRVAAEKSAQGWTHPYYWAPFILIGNWK